MFVLYQIIVNSSKKNVFKDYVDSYFVTKSIGDECR